jgi:hypothetical protein
MNTFQMRATSLTIISRVKCKPLWKNYVHDLSEVGTREKDFCFDRCAVGVLQKKWPEAIIYIGSSDDDLGFDAS